MNRDKLASQGMMFTDYYAEASCTAGRANFITGEIPLRTGLTTVGQAGADVGIPAQASTLATALKTQGYATGQLKIVDEGPPAPFPDMSNVPNMHDLPFVKVKYDMTTFDEVLVKASSSFMDQAKN